MYQTDLPLLQPLQLPSQQEQVLPDLRSFISFITAYVKYENINIARIIDRTIKSPLFTGI